MGIIEYKHHDIPTSWSKERLRQELRVHLETEKKLWEELIVAKNQVKIVQIQLANYMAKDSTLKFGKTNSITSLEIAELLLKGATCPKKVQ
jgi:hypothetical protein